MFFAQIVFFFDYRSYKTATVQLKLRFQLIASFSLDSASIIIERVIISSKDGQTILTLQREMPVIIETRHFRLKS